MHLVEVTTFISDFVQLIPGLFSFSCQALEKRTIREKIWAKNQYGLWKPFQIGGGLNRLHWARRSMEISPPPLPAWPVHDPPAAGFSLYQDAAIKIINTIFSFHHKKRHFSAVHSANEWHCPAHPGIKCFQLQEFCHGDTQQAVQCAGLKTHFDHQVIMPQLDITRSSCGPTAMHGAVLFLLLRK